MSGRAALWWGATAAVLAASAWVLNDAVRDLLAQPTFAAVVRVVIEAIAAAVLAAACIGAARRSGGARGNRSGRRQGRQHRQGSR